MLVLFLEVQLNNNYNPCLRPQILPKGKGLKTTQGRGDIALGTGTQA